MLAKNRKIKKIEKKIVYSDTDHSYNFLIHFLAFVGCFGPGLQLFLVELEIIHILYCIICIICCTLIINIVRVTDRLVHCCRVYYAYKDGYIRFLMRAGCCSFSC